MRSFFGCCFNHEQKSKTLYETNSHELTIDNVSNKTPDVVEIASKTLTNKFRIQIHESSREKHIKPNDSSLNINVEHVSNQKKYSNWGVKSPQLNRNTSNGRLHNMNSDWINPTNFASMSLNIDRYSTSSSIDCVQKHYN